MPQLGLSNGDLVKKTVRTTLVMLGTTVVWLGALTGAVMVSTSPSAGAAESKAEKVSSTPMPAASTGARGSAPGSRVLHRGAAGAPKSEVAHGDPI